MISVFADWAPREVVEGRFERATTSKQLHSFKKRERRDLTCECKSDDARVRGLRPKERCASRFFGKVNPKTDIF